MRTEVGTGVTRPQIENPWSHRELEEVGARPCGALTLDFWPPEL